MTQAGKKILVVDDSATNTLLLKGILEEEGYVIATASDGQKALNIVEIEQFDLILLDLMMPRVNGYEFMQKINPEILQTVPIIIISAKTSNEEIQEGLAKGAIAYMTKPIDVGDLLEKMSEILKT